MAPAITSPADRRLALDLLEEVAKNTPDEEQDKAVRQAQREIRQQAPALQIDAARAADELARIAADSPDHLGHGAEHGASSCRYLYDDGTRCIVGEFFARLGIDDSMLDNCKARADILVAGLKRAGYRIDISDEALDILQAAQVHQDAQRPWAVAVALALATTLRTNPVDAE